VAGTDVLRILQCHDTSNDSTKVPSLHYEPVVPQHIYHKLFERSCCVLWPKDWFCTCMTRPESGNARHDEVKRLCGVGGRGGKGLDGLASFEKGAGPAGDEEEGNGFGRGGTVVGVVEDLVTIVWDIYLDCELSKVGIDTRLYDCASDRTYYLEAELSAQIL